MTNNIAARAEQPLHCPKASHSRLSHIMVISDMVSSDMVSSDIVSFDMLSHNMPRPSILSPEMRMPKMRMEVSQLPADPWHHNCNAYLESHPLNAIARQQMALKLSRTIKAVVPSDNQNDTVILDKPKLESKKPAMFKVLLLNDDYTPMEFVILILERFFSKSRVEATRIMLLVHQQGVGVCGVYTYEVAETKVMQVNDFARKNQQPLQCTLEKD